MRLRELTWMADGDAVAGLWLTSSSGRNLFRQRTAQAPPGLICNRRIGKARFEQRHTSFSQDNRAIQPSRMLFHHWDSLGGGPFTFWAAPDNNYVASFS